MNMRGVFEWTETKEADSAPSRLPNGDSNQIFIHQDAFNSAYQALLKEPISINDPDLSSQLLQLLPELTEKLGNDFNLSILIQLGGKHPVQISDEFQIQGAIADIQFLTNGTFAFELQLTLNATLDLTLKNYTIYPLIRGAEVVEAKIVKDTVGIFKRNYAAVFTSVLESQVVDFNYWYGKGINLRQLDPTVDFLAGLYKNVTVQAVPEHLFLGFSFLTDVNN